MTSLGSFIDYRQITVVQLKFKLTKFNLVGIGPSGNLRAAVFPKNAIAVEDINRMLICDSF